MSAFERTWDLVKDDQRMAPSWMRTEEDDLADGVLPTVRVDENPPDGDACCADFRRGLASIIAFSDNYYGTQNVMTRSGMKQWRGQSDHFHTQLSTILTALDHDFEGASCDQLAQSVESAMAHGKFEHELGGDQGVYYDSFGFASQPEAFANYLETYEGNPDRDHELEVLSRLRQLKLEYDACKMGGFGDTKYNDTTGFYASADPFERTWDLVLKSFILDPDLRDAAKYDPYTYQLPTVSPGGLPRPEIVNYGKTNSVGDEYYTYYNLAHPFFRNKDWTARDEGSVEMTEDEMIQRIIDTIVHEEGHAAIDPPLRREAWEDWQNSEDEDARHGWFHPSKNTHEAGAMLIEGIPFEEQRDVLRRRGYL